MPHSVFTLCRSSPQTRLPRLPQPVDAPLPSGPTPALDISLSQNTSLHHYDDNVVRELSLPPASAYPSAPTRPRSPTNGSTSHPPAHFISNVSIDPFSRPRTPPVNVPHPSFFDRHGLPQSLPPPPRTTFYTQGPSNPSPAKDPEVSNIASYFDSLLRGSYSTMLSQNPESTVHDSAPEPHRPAAEVELTLDDMLQADYLDANFEEYLTSPLIQDDSPEETPFLPTPGEEAWNTSPMVDAGDDSFGLTDLPLFGAVVKPAADTSKAAEPESLDVLHLLQLCSPQLDLDKMDSVTPALDPLDAAALYTMPPTPALAPAALYHSPRLPSTAPTSSSSASSSTAPARPAKPLPTGTRRNITPAALVPLDAPTQPRQYALPSATSRKAVPAAFKGKKRARSEVEPDADADDADVDPDAIEAKRRQNTLAARRSRQRKLEHVRELEETVGRLTEDRDAWMQRAYGAEEKLRAHGIA